MADAELMEDLELAMILNVTIHNLPTGIELWRKRAQRKYDAMKQALREMPNE